MLPVAVVWFGVVRFGSGGPECFVGLFFLSLPCLAYNFYVSRHYTWVHFMFLYMSVGVFA